MQTIISFIYDGQTFFYTKEAILSARDIIGFYFDHLEFPQSIHRNSIYGQYVLDNYDKL